MKTKIIPLIVGFLLIISIYYGYNYFFSRSLSVDHTSLEDPSEMIENVKNSYLLELDGDTIGNIFEKSVLFDHVSWKAVNNEVVYQGYYCGEIVPGQGSILIITFVPNKNGHYCTIKEMRFNGRVTPETGTKSILEFIGKAYFNRW